MRTNILALLFVGSIMGSILLTACQQNQSPPFKENELTGTITISGAFALYPLTSRWAEEFKKLHPRVRIDVSAGGAGKGMTDVLSNMVDLGMFSKEISEAEVKKGIFGLEVARDAVLPTTSAKNPFLQKIYRKGMSREAFHKIFITGEYSSWGDALSDTSAEEINVYKRSDVCGASEIWANFIGGKQENLKGKLSFGDPEMAEAVKNDKYSMGYNNRNYTYNVKNGYLFEELAVVPIDINGNGMIDAEENFYGSQQELLKAIQEGTYPTPPARTLSFISWGKPNNPIVIAFLNYVLDDGQKLVP